MNDFVRILPFLVGASISPVLLVMMLFVLSRPKQPVLKSLVYLLGGGITITIITALIFASASSAPKLPSGAGNLPHIIIGMLLLFLAFDIYKKGPPKPAHKKAKSDGLSRYFIFGVVLMLTNFTTIAMIFEIALLLRELSIPSAQRAYYLMFTVVFSLLPILLPLLVVVLAGKYSQRILRALSIFMKKYSYLVTSAFFAIIGIYIILKTLI